MKMQCHSILSDDDDDDSDDGLSDLLGDLGISLT